MSPMLPRSGAASRMCAQKASTAWQVYPDTSTARLLAKSHGAQITPWSMAGEERRRSIIRAGCP
jgi:hypothetical protein